MAKLNATKAKRTSLPKATKAKDTKTTKTTKTTKAPSKEKNESKVKASSSMPQDEYIVEEPLTLNELETAINTVHGPSGGGKTVFIATGSDYWPDKKPKKKIKLEDILWGEIDKNGTSSLAEHDVFAPRYRFDQINADYNTPLDGLSKFQELVFDYVDTHNVKYVVIDTMSKLDKKIVTFLQKKHKNSNNKFAVWGELLTIHNKQIDFYNELPCGVWFAFHSKERQDPATVAVSMQSQVAAKNAAAAVEAMANIDLDIHGRAINSFRGESTLIGNIHKMQERGKTVRKVFFGLNKGFEGKCRFEKYLSDWREPNLGKMMKHLKKELDL